MRYSRAVPVKCAVRRSGVVGRFHANISSQLSHGSTISFRMGRCSSRKQLIRLAGLFSATVRDTCSLLCCRQDQDTSRCSRPGGSLGRLIRTSSPRCSWSGALRCRPSMISMRPFRAAKSQLALSTPRRGDEHALRGVLVVYHTCQRVDRLKDDNPALHNAKCLR